MQSFTASTSQPVSRSRFGRHCRTVRRSTTSMPAVSSPPVSMSAATVERSKSSGFVTATSPTTSCRLMPSLPSSCRCARKVCGSMARRMSPARDDSDGN